MHFSMQQWTSIALALTCVAVMGLILVIGRKRKKGDTNPIFLSYIAFGAIGTLIGLAGYVLAPCIQYTYILWTVSFLFTALEFGVMYELFKNAVKPYSALVDLGKILFGWASCFLLIVAVITAVATIGTQQSKLNAAISVLERSMRLIECRLLMLFFLFEKKLNLSWKTPSISLAIGLGSTAAADLSISYLRSAFGTYAGQFDIANTLVYLGVLSFWALSISTSTVQEKNVLDSPRRLIFQRWNETLASYSQGEVAFVSGVDSFLPNVERTVERVMARKMTH